jgi:hypothetical protein
MHKTATHLALLWLLSAFLSLTHSDVQIPIPNNLDSNNELSPKTTSTLPFSGVYAPYLSNGVEIYGGSWLASVDAVLNLRPRLDKIKDLEGASFFIVDSSCTKAFYIDPPDIDECRVMKRHMTLMTRDFFDFQVEHMYCTYLNIRVYADLHFTTL